MEDGHCTNFLIIIIIIIIIIVIIVVMYITFVLHFFVSLQTTTEERLHDDRLGNVKRYGCSVVFPCCIGVEAEFTADLDKTIKDALQRLLFLT